MVQLNMAKRAAADGESSNRHGLRPSRPAPARRHLHRRRGDVGGGRTAEVAARRQERVGAGSAPWRSGNAPRAMVAGVRESHGEAGRHDMTASIDKRRALLAAVLGFMRLDRRNGPKPAAVGALARWMDSWPG